MGHASSFLPASIYAANAGEQGHHRHGSIISIQTSVGDGVGLCVYRSVCEWGGVTSTVSLSMAALGYASVRFPLASRNVCRNDGMHLRPEAIPLWWQKRSACACGCWPPHLTRTSRPAARATVRSRSRTQSFPRNGSDETIDRCELRQWATYLLKEKHTLSVQSAHRQSVLDQCKSIEMHAALPLACIPIFPNFCSSWSRV